MKNIAIVNCLEVSKRCSGNGCIKAFNNKQGAFEKYEEENLVMTSFIQCSGCGEGVVEDLVTQCEELKKSNVKAIHLSSCIRSKCSYYDEFIERLSEDFEVVGYTHAKKK
jgi:predicted metal-binding protein